MLSLIFQRETILVPFLHLIFVLFLLLTMNLENYYFLKTVAVPLLSSKFRITYYGIFSSKIFGLLQKSSSPGFAPTKQILQVIHLCFLKLTS